MQNAQVFQLSGFRSQMLSLAANNMNLIKDLKTTSIIKLHATKIIKLIKYQKSHHSE